jgi:hypothetical protein
MEFNDIDKWPNGTLQWAPATDTRAWVDGYASVTPQRFLYDLGDAGGCPQNGTTIVRGQCNADWTQEDAWYVSWGATPSQAIPEVYTTNGSMAAQWANLSLYGYLAHNANIILAGALTTLGTCQQNGCSPSIANPPAQGWQQMYNALKLDTRTAQTLTWSTDMTWSSTH